jgi:hypothetical protein
MPRVLKKETLLTPAAGLDVTEPVKYEKHRAVFEYPSALIDGG